MSLPITRYCGGSDVMSDRHDVPAHPNRLERKHVAQPASTLQSRFDTQTGPEVIYGQRPRALAKPIESGDPIDQTELSGKLERKQYTNP
jgi:hypothetical protein